MTPVELLVSKLEAVRPSGRGWVARCPAHDDRQPSLSIGEGDAGQALIHCHAGCTAGEIVEALGLTLADLMSPSRGGASTRNGSAGKARRTGQPKSGVHHATADTAIRAIEIQRGPCSGRWTYRNAAGEAVGEILRWDTAEGKDILPISRTDDGWIVGGMPQPRPLYGLPEVLAAPKGSRVYICEGEKAADAARALGLIATTSAHGSGSAAQTDWSPLAGHEAVILPDADDSGEDYTDAVLTRLAVLSPAPVAKVVRLPGLAFGSGDDIVDFVAAHGGDVPTIKAEIEALTDKAEPEEPSANTEPTGFGIEAFRPFPLDALPGPLASYVRVCAKAIGCDPSFIALPLLVGFASAIGNSRRIQLKQGWTEPAIVWGAIVGESGTTKSPALELPLRPVRERQRQALRAYGTAMKLHEVEQLAYERDLAVWKRSKSDSDPPVAPEPPACPRCWTDDVTIEALAGLLQDNPRGVLVIRDELAGWMHFDRYSAKGRGGEAAKWLEMHGGRPLVVDRKTSGTIHVPEASVSIIGGIQPGTLARCIGQEHRDSGLLARLLLAMPPRRARRWTEADLDPETEKAMAHIFDSLYRLEPMPGADGEPEPVVLPLSPEGKQVWIEFFNEHNAEQAQLTGDLAAAWSKLEGYAARLALVHHLVREAAGERVGPAIDAVSVVGGVTMSRWFANEARRVYAVLREDDESRQQRQLIELIQRKGGDISARELVQDSRAFATVADAETALEALVETGHGTWRQPEQRGRGGPKAKRFALPAVYNVNVYGNTAPGAQNGNSVDVDTVGGAGVPQHNGAADGVGGPHPTAQQEPDDEEGGRDQAPDPFAHVTEAELVERAERLIREAELHGPAGAAALRDAWEERLAICGVDAGLSDQEAAGVALEELESMLH